jgi:hypothetical protein
MDKLERAELALAARGADHADFLRRDAAAKFVRRNEGVRLMQALLRGVDSVNRRAANELVALSAELAAVRQHNHRVAMITRLQRWFRRRMSLDARKKAARQRRQARIERLTQQQTLISRFVRTQLACRVTFQRKVAQLSRRIAMFGACVRGVALRARMPYLRWDNERFVARKRLQSALIIQHMWLFWKLMTEFVDPFQGLSHQEVTDGRRHFAAVRIQARFRQHRYGRPYALQLREVRRQREHEFHVLIAVISIQRWWKRAKANALLRRMRAAERVSREFYERRQLERWAGAVLLRFLRWASRKRRHDAILAWEADDARRRFELAEHLRRRLSATRIQRAFREHYEYRSAAVAAFDDDPPIALLSSLAARVEVLREANVVREMRENHGALRRCVQVRRATSERRRRLSERSVEHAAIVQDEQARVIQRAARRYLAQQQRSGSRPQSRAATVMESSESAPSSS